MNEADIKNGKCYSTVLNGYVDFIKQYTIRYHHTSYQVYHNFITTASSCHLRHTSDTFPNHSKATTDKYYYFQYKLSQES